MARQATGRVIPHKGKDGRTYRALRFTAYGKRRYVTLGTVTAKEAEAELRHVLADVERGTWQPPRAVEAPPGALERELIGRNPAKGKGRRVRERAPSRSYLETAAQIEALLDAAGEQDREATRERRHIERRALLATIIFAGLRIGELCSLRWRDVDLAAGWLTVGQAKTDAGRRRVKIRGALRDELLAARSRRSVEQDAHVFPTRTGRRQYEAKVRSGTLGGAVKRANKNLAERDLPPLPDKLTPHSLRRTFASVLYALGESPPVVMAEMGHTSPALALRVYAQAMRRGEGEQAQLRALIEGAHLADAGAQLADIGSQGESAPIEPAERQAA